MQPSQIQAGLGLLKKVLPDAVDAGASSHSRPALARESDLVVALVRLIRNNPALVGQLQAALAGNGIDIDGVAERMPSAAEQHNGVSAAQHAPIMCEDDS